MARQLTAVQRVADSIPTRSNLFCDTQIVALGLDVMCTYVKLYVCKRRKIKKIGPRLKYKSCCVNLCNTDNSVIQIFRCRYINL